MVRVVTPDFQLHKYPLSKKKKIMQYRPTTQPTLFNQGLGIKIIGSQIQPKLEESVYILYTFNKTSKEANCVQNKNKVMW